MKVKDLKALLENVPDDLELRYETLGFGTPLWFGPDVWEFRVVDGVFLIPVTAQEYPE